LEAIVPIVEGGLYEADKIEDAVESITFAAGSAGYASVDVSPRITRNKDTQTVDLTFVVDEGPRVYIERLDIVGNTQTLDHVVRRELLFSEGDAFNRILLDQSRNRIRSLGFFGDVTITEEPGTAPDKTIVKVNVEEQPTGELAFSVGYSSADAFLISVSATQRNFRGRGQSLTASIQSTSRQQNYEFRFTEPKFQDRNLAVGFDLFSTKTDYLNIANYENSVIGAGLRLGFPLANRTQLGLRYNLRQDDLNLRGTNDAGEIVTVSSLSQCLTTTSFSRSACDQVGKNITSSIGYSLVRDRRNDPVDPTRGYRLTWNQDVAGLGGDVNYFKQELKGAVYRGVASGFTLTGKLTAGLIEGWNDDDIRINNRFYKGGNSFRGFDTAGFGPREVSYASITSTALADTAPTEGVVSRPFFALENDDGSFSAITETSSSYVSGLQEATIDANGDVQERTVGDLGYFQTAALDAEGNVIRDIAAKGNALGGKQYAIGSLELSFPVPFAPEEMGIGGALFTEFGVLGSLDDVDLDRFDETNAGSNDAFDTLTVVESDLNLRASVGVSIFWDSPFGPIRFDFSELLASEEYDRTESFRFSTRTQF